MRITPANLYNKQSFTSIRNCVLKPGANPDFFTNNDIKHRNTTFFYRTDISWEHLTEFLEKQYKNTDKVNTYCYACSDGSEPYTLIIELNAGTQKSAKKFFPIIAKDYDESILKIAKSGVVYVPLEELREIQSRTGDYNKYFDKVVGKAQDVILGYKDGYYMRVGKNLSDNVQYEKANILDDIENIEPDNSVVLFRNAWPYLGSVKKMDELAQKLFDRLGNNSFVVMGEYDCRNGAFYSMRSAGFELVKPTLYLFRKPSIDKIYY